MQDIKDDIKATLTPEQLAAKDAAMLALLANAPGVAPSPVEPVTKKVTYHSKEYTLDVHGVPTKVLKVFGPTYINRRTRRELGKALAKKAGK